MLAAKVAKLSNYRQWAKAEIAALCDDIKIEVDAWKHLSVTAIAAENPSVDEYVKELEYRTAAAEKDARRLQFLVDNEDFQIEYTGEVTLREHIDAAQRIKDAGK